MTIFGLETESRLFLYQTEFMLFMGVRIAQSVKRFALRLATNISAARIRVASGMLANILSVEKISI